MSEEKKCRYCAMMIPQDAKICPCCRKKQGTTFTMGCLMVVITLVGIGIFSSIILKDKSRETTYRKVEKISETSLSPDRTAPKTPIINEPAPTLEYQLATINAHGYIPQDHTTVMRFRSLLDQLSTTYIESKQQIADMTIMARELLKKDGIEESPLNIMEGMNQLFSTKIENQKYAEYVSAYVALRSKGRTHTDAILGLQEVLHRMGVY